MSIKKLDDAALRAWVDGLIAKQSVIGVKAQGDRFAYGPLASASQLRLDFDVTIQSPKRYFLPEKETLMRFDPDKGFSSVVADEPFVLLGVHPYDVAAIAQMDQVFAKDNRDTHYLARRENATVVACDAQIRSENVFAGSMGTATAQEGFDVLLTQVNGATVVDARTEKGKALVQGIQDAPAADDAMLAKREQVWKDSSDLLNRHPLKCGPKELPALLEKNYDNAVWAEKAEQCYSCGSCNLVCPTCYCFDVQDDVDWDLKAGERSRKWDGCMLSEFALVAGGHNFREKRAARYRHRYYRKGKYLFDRMGQIACVGCGRCITACTTKIANPVEIYNTLLGSK